MLAGVASLERDDRTAQNRQVAVEIEILRKGGVFFKQGVWHPVVEDFAASSVAAHWLREAHGALRDETAHVVADGGASCLLRARTRGRHG